ncbi:EH domain-containing protein 1-like [Schistocerca nitens]|uniref:EH domain-containing protein 1-like n=1 Tax=Schistocerca nitens TaxID=7011 RepID=UPI0021176098|nr:EH domain-containing protein 1-like [Schistocerca nitens]
MAHGTSEFWKNCMTVAVVSLSMYYFLTSRDQDSEEVFENVLEGLQTIYTKKLLPLEQTYLFHEFHSPKLYESDFKAKPSVLLIGQYSTGKTSFVRYLLNDEYPGMRIGPEPTTDKFIVVMHGEKEGIIPGNALVMDPEKQFRPLSKFGNNFLNRFQCSIMNNEVLKSISIIDTPGILSGEMHHIDRGYDFTGVLEWFSERVDQIILLFDAHKLDISDEFKRAIEVLRIHTDKIRIVLNKADTVDHQQLMRVYGALMWSLGRIMHTPETARVYIGSFWDKPIRNDVHKRLFEDEEQDLFHEMQSLPRNAALWKLNELSRRARLAKVHAYIISTLHKEMPILYRKEAKKEHLIQHLDVIYKNIEHKYQISHGDFPELKKMQELLTEHDFSTFQPLKPELFETVEHMLQHDIPHLMEMIVQDEIQNNTEPEAQGGVFEISEEMNNDSSNKRKKKQSLTAATEKLKWSAEAKKEFGNPDLPDGVLGRIWKLSDIDSDGQLDSDEFSLAMHLLRNKVFQENLNQTPFSGGQDDKIEV